MTVGFGYLGVTLVDLSLISLTMFTGDVAASELALSMLDMKDVKITNNGNDYTITYKDSEGASLKQTCTYDPVKDQLSSTLYGADGKIAIFFEYVSSATPMPQYYIRRMRLMKSFGRILTRTTWRPSEYCQLRTNRRQS